jgi:hypothetical protein
LEAGRQSARLKGDERPLVKETMNTPLPTEVYVRPPKR